jgi:hypothetical protein
MRFEGLFKHLAISFGLALGVYIIAYWGIEHQRYSDGPWEVRFEQGTNGNPVMVVNQPTLKISNVRFEFQGAPVSTNLPLTVKFDQARQWPYTVGFGEVIFEDLTFEPGTVTMLCYGNEIELLPRVMSVNRQQYIWKSGFTMTLVPTNPPPPVELKLKKIKTKQE